MTPQVLRDYGTDVILNAGGGIHGHPHGPRAGATAMRQAIDLALEGAAFDEPLPTGHVELEAAIAQWGTS